MKTRIKDFLDTGTEPWTPVYSFQYAEGKRPTEADWKYVNAAGAPATWPTQAARDQARAFFTSRRSVQAAMADLPRAGLHTHTTAGQR